MAPEPDHVLLRRYVAAPDDGRERDAAELWQRLAVNNFDRITMLCRAFRFAGGTGLPPDEAGSAASEAYLRVVALGGAFRERELGQFRAAVHRTVHNTCLDYGRRELRHRRRSAGSIDAPYEPGGEAGPFDAALAAHDASRHRAAEEALEDEARRQEAAALVRWGIAQVRNESHRRTLELTYVERLDAAAIAEREGISPENVYQRRARGLRELERILRAGRP